MCSLDDEYTLARIAANVTRALVREPGPLPTSFESLRRFFSVHFQGQAIVTFDRKILSHDDQFVLVCRNFVAFLESLHAQR